MTDPNYTKPPRSPSKTIGTKLQLDSPTCVTKVEKELCGTPTSNKENYPPPPNEVNYEVNPTKLYQYIERKDWTSAIARCNERPFEAATIVYRQDASTQKLRWRQLPLHAAIVFKGKTAIVATLIKAYPQGVTVKDDLGMLPCHLAFRYSANEAVINLLLEAYPESVNIRDNKGRIPIALTRVTGKKSISLRTYVAHYHLMTKTAIVEEQKVLLSEKFKGLTDDHERDLQMIKQKYSHLEQCEIKCDELLKEAFLKIKLQEAELTASRSNNEKLEKLYQEMKELRNELHIERERNEELKRKAYDAEQIENQTKNNFDVQKAITSSEINELSIKIQKLEVDEQIKNVTIKQQEKDLKEMTHASEVLLNKVKGMGNELEQEKYRYAALKGKILSSGDKEEMLMNRVCDLTDNLVKRSAEKKTLIRKHAEDMRKLTDENAALRRKLRC